MHSRLNEKQSQYTKMEEELTIARKNYDQEVAKGSPFLFFRIKPISIV